MSRTMKIDTEGLKSIKAIANIFYNFADTLFEITFRNDFTPERNLSDTLSDIYFTFPLEKEIDEKEHKKHNEEDKIEETNEEIYDFHLFYQNTSYFPNKETSIVSVNSSSSLESSNLSDFSNHENSSDYFMKVKYLINSNQNIQINLTNVPINKSVVVSFRIFKKLQISVNDFGSTFALYPFNYKTCDFCCSSKNLSRKYDFKFDFDLYGHQNDQVFKIGKPQRKCKVLDNETDSILKYNISDEAKNKYNFYGFLLKLRLVKFPQFTIFNSTKFFYQVLNDTAPDTVIGNNESLHNKGENETNKGIPKNLTENYNKDNGNETKRIRYKQSYDNIGQITEFHFMPLKHKILILLDDDNTFWQKELENIVNNAFPNSLYQIGHFKGEGDSENNFTDFILFYRPDIIINYMKENVDIIGIYDSVVKSIDQIIITLKEQANSSDYFNDFLSQIDDIGIGNNKKKNETKTGNDNESNKEKDNKKEREMQRIIELLNNRKNLQYYLRKEKYEIFPIIDEVYKTDFQNIFYESNCGIDLNPTKMRFDFSYFLPNNCSNCSLRFNDYDYYSWKIIRFHSEKLYFRFLKEKYENDCLSAKLFNEISKYKTEDDKKLEIAVPITVEKSTFFNKRNISISIVADCNKCDSFYEICQQQLQQKKQNNSVFKEL